jgi:hypothetical protein
MMVARRKNFTDRQRAEIFVLDRALCSFSGKSLWLLDYGAAPSFVDWADHIGPAAKGGVADISNGACASHLYNWAKRDRPNAIFLFHRGSPTEDFFLHYEIVPKEIATHLRRFAALHWSDWLFNRSIFHVLVAAGQQGQHRGDGQNFKRDRNYWATASFRSLESWHKATGEAKSLKARKLLPLRPAVDHHILMELQAAASVQAVKRIIAAMVPYVRESWKATKEMANVESASGARNYLSYVLENPYVVPRTRKIVRHNMRALYGRGKPAAVRA